MVFSRNESGLNAFSKDYYEAPMRAGSASIRRNDWFALREKSLDRGYHLFSIDASNPPQVGMLDKDATTEDN